MDTIIILNYQAGVVEFIKLTDEHIREIENKYNHDIESWLADTFDDINLDDCHWMSVEGAADMYERIFRRGKWEMTQIFQTC